MKRPGCTMLETRSARTSVAQRRSSRSHHDEFGIVAQLVEHVRHRDHQRDRRDDQDGQRNDEAGDSDEDENALTLIRHQVDVAQRLRDPHERGHAGANHQERTERGAENIAADGPHPIYASPLATETSVRRAPDARQRRADAIPTPFYPLFDPATKWLGQGKVFEYAQQNVNLDRVSRRPQAPAKQALASPHRADL